MAKASVKTALQSRINQHFQNYHTTTSDFFQFDVAYFRELVPKQSLTLNLRTQARLAGMPVPSFADVSLNRRAFFVPMRVIYKPWNEFITQQPYYPTTGEALIPQSVPTFSLKEIINLFGHASMSTPVDAGNSYDFVISYLAGNNPFIHGYKFTDLGRHTYKLFQQLGYSFQFQNVSQTLDQLNTVKYSALPLLAVVRVYMDWYYPSAYRPVELDYMTVQSYLRKCQETPAFELTYTYMIQMLRMVHYVPYGHDYFTDAFDNPLGNNSVNPSMRIPDPESEYISARTGADASQGTNNHGSVSTQLGLKFPVGTGSTYGVLTQFALNALAKMTAYMKRRQIAGSRVLENYLAEYGVKLPSANLDMSVYLTGDSVPVIIKDITATSQTLSDDGTVGANLGDYSGQGRIYADSNLHVVCDTNGEYGFIFVITSLVPKIGYVQGVRRHCLHIKPLDFYHGDYDGLGNREIRLDELAVPDADDSMTLNHETPWNEAFGFTPQYSEYKVQHDSLTGDFRVASLATAGFTSDAWHLNRMFLPVQHSLTVPTHSLDFVMPNDKSQYSRIFYVQDSENLDANADHFVLNHLQDCESSAPFKPLYEDYNLEHMDGNNSVTLDANGNYMN